MAHLTMRGRKFDYESFKLINQNVLPVGGGRINVMGDILDENGKVLKSQDDINKEWLHRQSDDTQVRRSNIKTIGDDLLTSRDETPKVNQSQSRVHQAPITPQVSEPKNVGKRPRRMVESDT